MNYIFDTGFIDICYSLIFDQTIQHFENYLTPTDTRAANIYTTREEIIKNPYGFKYKGSKSFSEFQCLMVKTGNYLLDYNACMFHGALMEWKDMGILFSAPSGTGKTTQYRLWRHLDSVRMINGDKPILHFDGEKIMGHSSPWNGKEKYGDTGLSKPLKAIILLEQGGSNSIELLSPSDAVVPLFTQFIAYPDSTDIIQKEARFLDSMLDSVPVWKLTNKGDIDSAKITREVLEAYYDV